MSDNMFRVKSKVHQLTEMWHTDAGIDVSLKEYLGMTAAEFDLWVRKGTLPDWWEDEV